MSRSKQKYAQALGDEDEVASSAVAKAAAELAMLLAEPLWKRAVVLYLVDPDVNPTGNGVGHLKIGKKYEWMGESEIGVLFEPSLAEVWKVFS